MSSPRFVSWIAPATISLDDAVFRSTRTTSLIDGSVATPSVRAGVAIGAVPAPCSQKIGPESMNWLATVRADVTKPPGLPRRSTTIFFWPALTSALRAATNWAEALSEKPLRAM
jgi:hypothetical protein